MEPPERASRLPRLRGARLDVVLAIGITLVAGVLRFARLGEPNDIIPLDETYYAVNSFGYLDHGVDAACSGGANPEEILIGGIPCPAEHTLVPAFAVHPPVGKWLIAAGIKVFGYSSFGYRAGAALFGTLSVLVLYMLARRLWRSPWIAATAASLLAIDGLHFVQSRIAMLDIFLAFFILLAVWLLVEDRERTPLAYRGIRGWRIAAGVAVGLALATKWSAAFVIPMLFVVALVWELDRGARARRAVAALATADAAVEPAPAFLREETEPEAEPAVNATPAPDEAVEVSGDLEGLTETGVEAGPPAMPPPAAAAMLDARHPASGGGVAKALWVAGSLVLVPLVVYVLTYGAWFAAKADVHATAEPEGPRYTAPLCDDPQFAGFFLHPVTSTIWNQDVWPANWRSWVCYQREIFNYHKNLKNFDEKGKPIHPYLTRAWSWPWIGRPTAHEFDSRPTSIEGNPRQAEILGLPNPAAWFVGFFVALPLCAFWAVKRKDQTAALLLLLFAPLYVPWLVTSRPLFMFYMTPAVAFLILLLCHVLHRALEEWSVEKQRLLAVTILVLPFTPLFIQWFAVPGFTIQLGNNVTPGTQSVPTILIKMLAVIGTAFVVWAAVSVLYRGGRPARMLAWYTGFAFVLFAYFYPVLGAVHIPDTGKEMTGVRRVVWQAYGWRPHMWLTADCRSEGIKTGCWI